MSYSVEMNERQMLNVKNMLKGFERQIPFATAMGLTDIAWKVRKDEQNEMERVFDNPTPYTLRNMYVKRATKKNLNAVVYFRNNDQFGGSDYRFFSPELDTDDNSYLSPQVHGGTRNKKRSEWLLQRRGYIEPKEFLVPSRQQRKNKYGNVSRGEVQKVLSALHAQFDPYNNETSTSKERKRKEGELGYFAIKRKGRAKDRSDDRIPGIYKRLKSRTQLVYLAVDHVNYKPIFKFYDVSQASVSRHWESSMAQAVEKLIRQDLEFASRVPR